MSWSNWFGLLSPPTRRTPLGVAFDDISESHRPEPDPEPVVEKEPEPSYYDTVLVPMVKAKEQEVLAEQPARLTEYIAQHKKHYDGYSIECVRHGDYLTLFMTRLGNPESLGTGIDKDLHTPQRFTTSVNLILAKTITLIKGRGPGLYGFTEYSSYDTIVDAKACQKALEQENKCYPVFSTYGIQRSPLIKPFEGVVREINAHPRGSFDQHQFVNGEVADPLAYNRSRMSPSLSTYGHGMGSPLDKLATKGTAVSALDDLIFFEGVTTLSVPFGKGEEVCQKILTAIEEGYVPKEIVKDQNHG